MQLITFDAGKGGPRIGLLEDDSVVDLSTSQGLPTEMGALIAAGDAALQQVTALRERWRQGGLREATVRREDVRLLAPLACPSKIVAVGLNYMDHCRETNIPCPSRPLLFAKFPSSVNDPEGVIEWDPALTDQVDYEAELAVVIGKKARNVAASEAMDVIFGYTCANDVTARDLQEGDGQWVRGKSLDTFGPLGPAITTRDAIARPDNLAIACRVNGETVQSSNTRELIFGIPALIEFITRAFSLFPGDIIMTGTPHGTGGFQTPPRYLKTGDVVEVEIEQLGVLRNTCREVRA